MKKIVFLIIACFFSAHFISASDIVTKDRNVLPAEIRSFIDKYFSNEEISVIEIDKKKLGPDHYEIRFVSNKEIELDEKGEWLEIDCKNAPVPEGIILPAITKYVEENYPNTFITQIKRKKWGYETELSNGLEISFNTKGKMMQIDD